MLRFNSLICVPGLEEDITHQTCSNVLVKVIAQFQGKAECLRIYGNELNLINHCVVHPLRNLEQSVYIIGKSGKKEYRVLNPQAFEEIVGYLNAFHLENTGFPHIIGNNFMQPVNLVSPGQRPLQIMIHPVPDAQPIHRLQGMLASFHSAITDGELYKILGFAPRTFESMYETRKAVSLMKTPMVSSLTTSFTLDKHEQYAMPPDAGPEFSPFLKMFKELLTLMFYPAKKANPIL